MTSFDSLRLPAILGITAIVVALGLYTVGAFQSSLLSEEIAERKAYIARHTPLDRAERRAKAYWKRYPDVAAHPFFGENGVQGIYGPLVHFDRHGRSEGRLWDR